MVDQALLFRFLAEGRVDGFSSEPGMVETVISRVFLFEREQIVLKFYKRDNTWWNTKMRDLSHGKWRRKFIEDDFAFNHMLNPAVYTAVKTIVVEDDHLRLVDLSGDEDELVIVMRWIDTSQTLTQVLSKQELPVETYEEIGRSFAKTKLEIPRNFLPETEMSWYEHMQKRLDDLASWMQSVEAFPQNVGASGVEKLRVTLEEKKESFSKIDRGQLSVLIDCNSENLLFKDGALSYLDAYPPKREWLIGVFEADIFRVGADIFALAGKDAYEAYMHGVLEAAGDKIDQSTESFYLLYGALISAPYYFMLNAKSSTYLAQAHAAVAFIELLSAENV